MAKGFHSKAVDTSPRPVFAAYPYLSGIKNAENRNLQIMQQDYFDTLEEVFRQCQKI